MPFSNVIKLKAVGISIADRATPRTAVRRQDPLTGAVADLDAVAIASVRARRAGRHGTCRGRRPRLAVDCAEGGHEQGHDSSGEMHLASAGSLAQDVSSCERCGRKT